MTSADNRKLYDNYLKRIQRCRLELPCLVCGEKKNPIDFKKHFERVHCHLENTCCWCLKYNWPAQEKTQHAKHLLDCFNRLLLNFKVSSEDPARNADLKNFQKRLARMNRRTICQWQNFSCSQQIKPGEMEKHFRMEHSPFDPTVSCVWCEGAVSWPRGQKNQNVDHLESCFENYRKKEKELKNSEKATCSRDRAVSPPSEYEKFWAAHVSTHDPFQYVKNFLGREKVLPHFDEAYEPAIENFRLCSWFPSSRPDTHQVSFEKVVELPRFFVDCFRYMNHVPEDDDGAYEENDDDDEIGKGREMAGASATWYHVMISAYAFEQFLRALKAFGEDKVFALPFWCWCDGGRYEKAIFRHHRHMILVVENGRDFKTKCWNKLSRVVHNKQYKKKKAEEDILHEPLPDGFCFGHSEMIKTWLHLVNTMQYLSLPHSGCQYHFEKLSRPKNVEEPLSENETKNQKMPLKKRPRQRTRSQRHYFMGSGWHPMQMLCLALSAGGMYAFLHQKNGSRSKSFDVECIFRWPPNQKHAPWYIRLGNLTTECNRVLPVKKYWRPVRVISANERWLYDKKDDESYSFLNLMEGDKLLFKRDDSLLMLSDDEWFQVQKEGGNLFYNVIADYRWKLSRPQQIIFNTGQRMVEVKNKEWELKVKQLEKDIELLQKDNELLQKDNELLQKDNELLQKDNELLKQKTLSTQLDEENVTKKT